MTGMTWLIVIVESSLEVITAVVVVLVLAVFKGVVVIVGVPVELTRENCLNTCDNDELAVWWCGNMGTACCMLCWNVWLVFMGEDVIEIICELLLPAAFAFANKVFTVWFDEFIVEVVEGDEDNEDDDEADEADWLVKLAIVVETTWGLAWTFVLANLSGI